MRCDIVIPVWNELEATKECIDSIVKNTNYPHKLIIVDDDSGRDTAGYLAGLKIRADINVSLIRNDENLGFAKAVNQGILASDAAYVCIMNNDTIASPGWLEEMIGIMTAHPEIGILNPSSNTSGQFPAHRSIDNYAASLKGLSGQIQELYRARGFCMLIRREIIEKIGLFDESYGRGYFEETDYSYRAQSTGIRIARVKSAYVYHKESRTFNALTDREELFSRNEKIFQEKWGKSLKIGYVLDRIDSKERINDIAVSVARSGHQIWIFLKSGLDWPVSIDHFDIRRVGMSLFFFKAAAIWQILKRKKKKKLEIIMTDNAAFGSFLINIKSIHGADVIISAEKAEFIRLLKDKSK